MKITLEHYDQKSTLEINHDDVDISEMMDLLKRLVISAGFGESTWNEGILTQAEELELSNVQKKT